MVPEPPDDRGIPDSPAEGAGASRPGMTPDAERDRALLTSIVESSDDAIVSKNLEGVITSWNAGAERLFGYAAAEAIGQPITILLPEDRLDEEPGIVARIQRGERVEHFETVRQRKDASLVEVSVTVSPIYDLHGRVVGASNISRDISQRRRTEAALRRTEERYGHLAELLPVGVFSISADGVITYFNRHATNLWGRSPEPGERYEELFRSLRLYRRDQDTSLRLEESPVIAALRDGRRTRNEALVVEGPDGARVPVLVNVDPIRDQSGGVEGCVVVVNDVSALRRAESALEAQRSDLEAVLETVPVAVFIAHDSEGHWITGNRAAYEMLRMPIGSNLSSGPPPGEDQDVPFRLFRDGKEIHPADLPIQRAARGETALDEPIEQHFDDGTIRHTLVSARPIYDEAGRPRGSVGASLDVTELRASEQALREADRLKDEFLATLSHELRNPLAPIMTGFEIMRMVDDPETVQRTRETMERQTRQLVRLVDDLLDVSRITRGKLSLKTRPTDLGRVLQDAVAIASPAIEERGHALEVTVPEPPLTIQADPERLTQVVANLLNNAALYTPPGGRVALEAAREGASARISVTDTGPGVPEEMQERIFEMFAQVDRPHERGHTGLGVGLTLARSLVELHAGTIEVASGGPEGGSTFTVLLPVEAPSPPQKAELWDAPNATSARRVLVVDDNEAFVESLSLVIEMLGHDVRTAADGQEAFDVASEFRPDVVLMDLGMPGVNGYEAARLIRSEPWGREMTLVALTGWGQDEDRERTREAGFNHHLVKPAKPEELRRLLAV